MLQMRGLHPKRLYPVALWAACPPIHELDTNQQQPSRHIESLKALLGYFLKYPVVCRNPANVNQRLTSLAGNVGAHQPLPTVISLSARRLLAYPYVGWVSLPNPLSAREKHMPAP
jgi:hypothetical protein